MSGPPICEKLLLRVAAHILEGQHRNWRLVGQRERWSCRCRLGFSPAALELARRRAVTVCDWSST